MSIIKVPIILLLIKAFRSSMTPPQPRAAEEELVPSTRLEGNTFADVIPYLSIFPQLAGYVEVITILATLIPSPISQKFLSLTVFMAHQHPRLGLNGLSFAAALMVLTGAAVRLRAYQDLGNLFRFNVSLQEDHRLIKTGVYSYVRHPAYTGGMMVIVGWFLWNGARGSWLRESGFFETWIGRILTVGEGLLLAMLFLISLRRIPKEDEILKKTFGKEWEDWARKVPHALVPWVY